MDVLYGTLVTVFGQHKSAAPAPRGYGTGLLLMWPFSGARPALPAHSPPLLLLFSGEKEVIEQKTWGGEDSGG